MSVTIFQSEIDWGHVSKKYQRAKTNVERLNLLARSEQKQKKYDILIESLKKNTKSAALEVNTIKPCGNFNAEVGGYYRARNKVREVVETSYHKSIIVIKLDSTSLRDLADLLNIDTKVIVFIITINEDCENRNLNMFLDRLDDLSKVTYSKLEQNYNKST